MPVDKEKVIAKTATTREAPPQAEPEKQGYLVTARKWRPMVFDDIVGQEHITRTLRNAIATNRLSHAYIFSGPRGVGKTTTARILAKAINCLHPQDLNPDNACDLCVEITEGRSVNVFEIDGASNRGVDEIRNLRDSVRYGPAKGRYKVYIIDEVHMLTKEAFNALLKTLEEPPAYVVFIFATTEIHKVPLTILSRCQRFDFRRIATTEIVERLRYIASEEKITVNDDALLLVARRGDGSLRDAQSIFDQIVSFCGTTIDHGRIMAMLNVVDDELFFRLTSAVKEGSAAAGLQLVEEIVVRGYDLREFINGLIEHFRNLLIVRATGSTKLLEMSEAHRRRFEETASAFAEADLLRLLKIANDTEAALRWSQQPRYKLEFGVLQMIKMDGSVQIQDVLNELKELKKDLEGNGDPSQASRRFASPSLGATPLRGDVKATPPVLRPEQRVTPAPSIREPLFNAQPFPDIPVSGGAVPPATIPSVESPVKLSQKEVEGRWPLLVDEARKQRIAVGTMLSESSLISLQENRLCVGCPDDFTLDSLKRNSQFLLEVARKVYGAKVYFDAILADQRNNVEKAPSPDGSGKSVSTENPLRQHPVVQALIRDIGAREVE